MTQTAPSPITAIDLEAPTTPVGGELPVILAPRDWYSTPPPPREWLLRDLRHDNAGVLARRCVGLLVAQGGAGKTMALAQLAVSVATGRPWLGVYDISTAGRVLLVLGEEDRDECHRRLWRALHATGTQPPPEGSIACLPLAGVACAFLDAEGNETTFAARLRGHVVAERYAAVLIDPLSRFGGPDVERDNAAATRAIQICETLASSGATVVVAHHTAQWDRGRFRQETSTAAARGVTGITDGARWVMHFGVERHSDVDEHLREVVTATITKSNYAHRGDPVQLRRDLEHGGALVALDDVDRNMLEQSRATSPASGQRASRTTRDAADDAALKALITRRPGIFTRELYAEMHAYCVSRQRVDAALARCAIERRAVDGRAHALGHFMPAGETP